MPGVGGGGQRQITESDLEDLRNKFHLLEGDRKASVSVRLNARLAKLGQEMLFGLRNASGSGSALCRHAGSVSLAQSSMSPSCPG